jgi:hypothetical protein
MTAVPRLRSLCATIGREQPTGEQRGWDGEARALWAVLLITRSTFVDWCTGALSVAVATIAITAQITTPQPPELKTASSTLALIQIKDGVVGVVVVYVAR